MLKRVAGIFADALLFLFIFTGASFCQDADISLLVDQYDSGTDLQKAAIEREFIGRNISVTGIVSDVKDEDTFDVVNDVKRFYYGVITEVANTAAGNPYRAVLIYKDKNRVEDINKGQEISFTGNMIKVADDRLYLSVWLSADELTEHERELFK
jgi:hypothetical protein